MPEFMPTQYDPGVVAASLLMALLSSFVTFSMTRRMRSHESAMARIWWMVGALVMGTGIWATHFVGMLAFALPVPIGYGYGLTAASWLGVVLSSALMLHVLGLQGSQPAARRSIIQAAVLNGLGIVLMHYTGMLAIDLTPAIVWDGRWVAASVLMATGGSWAALTLFVRAEACTARVAALTALGAASLMALTVGGMHYVGMAAAGFPAGAVCLSADQLGGPGLTAVVLTAAVLMLLASLLTSALDARQQSQATRLALSLRTANEQLQSSNEQLQTANDELQRLAFRDALTGLPNRILFEDRLEQALLRLERRAHRLAGRPVVDNAERLAVLFVDLDGFKPINDTYGHAVGDSVLSEIGQRLRQTVRDADTLARIGGDEFVVLMEGLRSEADAQAMAERLLACISPPIPVPGRDVQLSCSVGIVLYPGPAPRDKLLACADAAMYRAKRAGGAGVVVYAAHMDVAAAYQVELQQDLRMAIERRQLALHYQPKVDGRSGRICGVEALLRWQHPERGAVSPAVFIPLAERFGLINALGNWVIDEASRQLQRWEGQGLSMRVAINLSAHQLRQPDLPERIRHALQRRGVDPARLTCEITETVAMEDTRVTLDLLFGLRQLGVKLSIDDFGTGYSSLSYLRQLPARELKIDRSFVKDLGDSDDARAVVDAVVRLAHALGLRVVAEGVETALQRDLLLVLGCDELQGYFYARPMAADALLAWARGDHPVSSPDFSTSLLGDVPPPL